VRVCSREDCSGAGERRGGLALTPFAAGFSENNRLNRGEEDGVEDEDEDESVDDFLLVSDVANLTVIPWHRNCLDRDCGNCSRPRSIWPAEVI
jgi:hypothetical protein